MTKSSCWRTFRGLLASFLVAALLFSLPGSAWAGGVTWTARAATEANQWYDVTYGNGLFVAVADSGTNRVMTSPDGTTWTARAAAINNGWRGVTYGNGLFVAVAQTGFNWPGTDRVMTSPDGITWTVRAAAEANGWQDVTYGNGLFVAVANDGTNRVMTSPDGITWTSRAATEANKWYGVTYGNGLFVAVAYSGTNRVMTSPDGITWTARAATEANQWFAITYGNGLFVAVAQTGTNRVMTSPDGITWTARAAAEANGWLGVTYGNGLFVAVAVSGTNRVMTSPDGVTWTARAAAEANHWYDVTYGNGLFVAVAYNGTNRVMTSKAPGFTLSTSTATVSETGTTATFTVVLDAQPGSDVVFSVVSADAGEATVDKATLTFTNANWNSPQTVTVTGIDDDVVDGNQATTITVAVVDASSDDSYDALADQTVTVTTTQNDVPPPPPGVSTYCGSSTRWGAPFADVRNLSPVFADVGCLYHSGVVVDDGSGLYRPDDVTTRAEIVTFAARTLLPVRGLCPSRRPPFTDMDSASPIAGELACMYGLGVVRGRTGTTFDPDTGVTRAEAAAIIARFYQAVSRPRWSASCSAAINPFDDTIEHWSEPNITCVNALGIITGTTTGTFSPEATVTRAETATMWKNTIVSLP